MTDITKLAQREKFEAWAEERCALPWGYLKNRRTNTGYFSKHDYTSLWAAWKAAGAELVEALEKAQAINAAAEKLVRCKGRYHSELNYRALAALFGVTTPDLPPIDGESRAVKLPVGYTASSGHPFNEAERTVMIPGGGDWLNRFDVEHVLTAAGIKLEAE